MDILFAAGNFDDNGGRPSGLAEKMAEVIRQMKGKNLTFMNGGTYNELVETAYSASRFNVILWFANVPNEKPKINVKDYAPRALLVSSKRNNNEYEFHELVMHALKKKASLTFEFNKNDSKDGKFRIMVFDVLGNQWYKGYDYEAAVKAAFERIELLINVKREPSNPTSFDLMWYFKWFRDNVGRPNDAELVLVPNVFQELITDVSNQLYKNVWNLDTRCNRSFPSFKDENGFIFIGTREIKDRYISGKDFVRISDDNGITYYGNQKASVDAPIHMAIYRNIPKIRYIIHTHCYIEGPNFDDGEAMTKIPYPCGALQEADQILNTIKADYMSKGQELKNISFAAINEKGHGSIVMSSSAEYLKEFFELHRYVCRPIPESQN